MYVFVVRHGARADKQGKGSTTEYRESCAPGHEYDPPLTPFGREQAYETGKEIARLCGIGKDYSSQSKAPLKVRRIRTLVSSPFIRCVETATALSLALNDAAAATTSSSSSSTASSASSVPQQIDLDPGLSEWLGKDLFPTKPRHLHSHLVPDYVRQTVEQLSGGSGGGAQAVDPSSRTPKLARVADSDSAEVTLLASWPEGKPEATTRNAAASSRAVTAALVMDDKSTPSTAAIDTAAADDNESGLDLPEADAVILVTHQYGAHSIVSDMINSYLRLEAEKKEASEREEGSAMKKSNKNIRYNFKKEGVAQAQLAAASDEGLCCFGKTSADLCGGSFPVDFALANLSVLVVDDPARRPDAGRCLILSQAPAQSS